MAIFESKHPPFGVRPENTDPRFSFPQGRELEPALPLPEQQYLHPLQPNGYTEMPEDAIRAASINREIASQKAANSYGNTALPEEPTLWGYKYALRQNDGANGIQFNARTFGLFDGIIVKKCGIDEEGRSTHPAFNGGDYHNKYAPLRRNLALLRNYLLTRNPVAGHDENVRDMQMMAEVLGHKLSGGSPQPTILDRVITTIKRIFTGKSLSEPYTSDFLEVANMPDRGAALMYQYLHDYANRPSLVNQIPFTTTPRDWNLLPLDETPFSANNILIYSAPARMQRIVDAFDSVVGDVRSVDELQRKDKRISVDEAHKILENLRIDLASGRDERQIDILEPKIRESQRLLQAALCYRGTLAELARQDPNLLTDPELNLGQGIEALEKINYRLKVEQERMLEKGAFPAQARSMGGRISATPKRYRTAEPIDKLIDKLDESLLKAGQAEKKHVASKGHSVQQSKSPVHQSAKALNLHVNTQQQVKQETHKKTAKNAAGQVGALKTGLDKMANPKVSQVSNAAYVKMAEEANREREVQPQKENNGGPKIGQ